MAIIGYITVGLVCVVMSEASRILTGNSSDPNLLVHQCTRVGRMNVSICIPNGPSTLASASLVNQVITKRYFCELLYLQENVIPSGVPNLIPPSSDKLDMPRLESDTPKFLNNSREFGDEHKKWWAEVFASTPNFYAQTEKPSTWHLDELIARKMHQDEEEATPEGTVASTSNEINSNTACNNFIHTNNSRITKQCIK